MPTGHPRFMPPDWWYDHQLRRIGWCLVPRSQFSPLGELQARDEDVRVQFSSRPDLVTAVIVHGSDRTRRYWCHGPMTTYGVFRKYWRRWALEWSIAQSKQSPDGAVPAPPFPSLPDAPLPSKPWSEDQAAPAPPSQPPAPVASATPDDLFCEYCGSLGHLDADCPNRGAGPA